MLRAGGRPSSAHSPQRAGLAAVAAANRCYLDSTLPAWGTPALRSHLSPPLLRSHRWAGRAANFPTPYPIVTLRLRRCLLSAYRSSPSCDVHSRRASERSARPCPHIASFTRSAELAGESCRLAQRRSHALGGKVTCLRSAACWAVSPPLYFLRPPQQQQ